MFRCHRTQKETFAAQNHNDFLILNFLAREPAEPKNLEELESQIANACVLAIIALATTHLSTCAHGMVSTYVESYEFLRRN